ncbi:MAG: adenylate/guanylate cyclase domain-containing protein [Lachnospiraceae bacterium]|nr:adenylate/guanylate cyclase domain-containing protein [Lachnospiraceae bacterium]
MLKKNLKTIITCLVCGIVAFVTTYMGLLGSVDQRVEDILYHHAQNVNGNIKIIKIDDKTMNQMGDFSTWNRDVYADLVETLCVSEDIRPEVIGFDVLFSSNKDAKSDERFAEVCEKYDNVVTGFSYVFSSELVTDEDGNLALNNMAVQEKVIPYEALREVTDQGFVNALMDAKDSTIRNAFVYFDEEDGTRALSFNAAVYEKYMKAVGKVPTYPSEENGMTIRYSGEPGDYESVSLVDVLNGTVPAEAFDGCIVLVGAYAAGMLDAYFVPVERSAQMYGVEIHANIIQAYMEGKDLVEIPVWIDAVIAAIIAMALALICEKLSVIKVVLVCSGTALLKLLIGGILFATGYTGNVIVVPGLAIIIAVYYIASHYYKASAAKRSIEKAFSKYVAPQVVDEINKGGEYELKLGGENRNVAVLFVDIRGFTPLSESLEPEQVVDILNGYLALTTESIFRHGGTLDKFIGDATMAVFNAPFDTDDYIYKAVLTAWDIVQGGNRIEKEYLARYGKHVGFGVGINCGPAVVGNIGCDFRMDYTVIGDTVNTAARLEANAPRGTVYISEYVYEKVKERITVEEVGEIPLKGKSKGVFVYSITGVNGYVSPEEG